MINKNINKNLDKAITSINIKIILINKINNIIMIIINHSQKSKHINPT